MEFNEYQRKSLRTWNRSDLTRRERIVNALFGLLEVGEVIQEFKKAWFHRNEPEVNRDQLVKELGDALYYMAVLCLEHGISFEEVAYTNIEKLKARWPDGFTPSQARSTPLHTFDFLGVCVRCGAMSEDVAKNDGPSFCVR